MSKHFSSFAIKQAAAACHHGGVICYPTESVFGLGCDPQNHIAVMSLLQLKKRPANKGLILIAASIEQLQPYIKASPKELKKLATPSSPTTWLVDPSTFTPCWITGQHKKIAVRITQHPVAKQLCNQLRHPIVSTSANPAGKKPAKTILKSRIYFKDNVDYYLCAQTGGLNKPTQIIDLDSNTVIRKS